MIVGASRTGKSSWARTLGKHIYFRNMYDLSEYDPEADYVVEDDISLEHVHAAKCWVGAMGQFTDTDKYRTKRTISWVGKCCIVLCNRGAMWD